MNNYHWNQQTPAPYGQAGHPYGQTGHNPYDPNAYQAPAAPASYDPYASGYAPAAGSYAPQQPAAAPSYGYGPATPQGSSYPATSGYAQNNYAAPPAYTAPAQTWPAQQGANAWAQQPQPAATSVVQYQQVPYNPTTQVNKIIGTGPDVSLAELQAGRLPFNRIVGTRVKHDYLGRNICSRLNEGGKLSEQELALTARDRLVFTSVDKRKLNPQTQVFTGAPHEKHELANHFRQKLYMCRLSTGRVYAIFEPDPKSSDAYNMLRSWAEDLAARNGQEPVGREWGTTGFDQSRFTFDMPPQY